MMSCMLVQRREPIFIPDDYQLPVDSFLIPPQYQPYLSHVLLPHGTIIDRIEKLAADIRDDHPGATPHLLVVLKVRVT